jgi:hypothetical protein
MTVNTTFSAGQIFTAAQANAFPRGLVAAPVSSSTADSTITVEEVMLTYTFTAVSGRNYQVFYSEPSLTATVAATITARLREDNLTGATINSAQSTAVSATAQQIIAQAIFTASASGSKTLVATLLSSAGTATASRNAQRFATMYVLDIGSGY